MKTATPRQKEVLATIHGLRIIAGYAPSIVELGEKLGLKSKNATADHLRALKKKGLVDWRPNAARTLSLTSRGLREIGIGRRTTARPAPSMLVGESAKAGVR